MSLGGIGNLDYAVILCRDMAATRAFYRDVMGFPIEQDLPNWVSFRVGASLLTLRPRGPWSVCDDGPIPLGTAAMQLAFRVPLDAVDHCAGRQGRADPAAAHGPAGLAPSHAVLPRPRGQHHRDLRRVLRGAA